MALKDNRHRDLHNALTDGRIDSETYSREIENLNRGATRKMLRKNLTAVIKRRHSHPSGTH